MQGALRIALLSFEYPFETGFGGIGTYTWYQARALARLGHEVHVLAGALEPTEMRREDRDGVTVFRHRRRPRWPRLQALADRHCMWWTKNRLETAFSMRDGLRRMLGAGRYDVVEVPECGGEGTFLDLGPETPTIVRFHSPARLIMDTYDVRRLDRILCPMVEQRAVRRATGFTSCSHFLATEVADKLGVRRHVEVIPNGIDLDLFDAEDRMDVAERFGLPADLPWVLFAGRLERRKGIHVMKEVAARVLEQHEAAFLFAGHDLFQYGENELRPHLEARRLRGSFHLLGRLDLATVRSLLRRADVFVIPSLWENCPYSCLEAMAARAPIVSSDAGGLPELIEDGVNGLLAPVGDVEGHTAAVTRLLADESLRRRLGTAARGTVEARLTDVIVAQRSADYYRRVRSEAG